MLKVLHSLVPHHLSNLLVNQLFHDPLCGLENFLERLKENSEKHVCLCVWTCENICNPGPHMCQAPSLPQSIIPAPAVRFIYRLYHRDMTDYSLSSSFSSFPGRWAKSLEFHLNLGPSLLMTSLTFSKVKSLKENAFPLL